MEAFGIVNKDVVTDPELSIQAKGVYAIICTFANKERSCFPSINTIADLANTHPRTISRKLKELSSKGYIHRKGRKLFLK
jgi:DNA-binding transcriptional regulator YhcF (GntR family)|tara:strand:- start:2055 stop:2294 length:240 start_codon:yes stop_codon:yes gene_type:complete